MTKAYQWVEFFAGSRVATTSVQQRGYAATCVDLDDHMQYGYAKGGGTVFDILSPSGFVQLDLFRFLSWISKNLLHKCGIRHCVPITLFVFRWRFFRLCIKALLSTDPAGFVIWLGVLCSTWSVVSRGSTLRNWLDAHGDLSRPCVVEGNLMVARSCVLVNPLVHNVLHNLEPPQKHVYLILFATLVYKRYDAS